MSGIVIYVDKHREDLELIFFESEGSSLSGFCDELIEECMRGHVEYLRYLARVSPDTAGAARVSRHEGSSEPGEKRVVFLEHG